MSAAGRRARPSFQPGAEGRWAEARPPVSICRRPSHRAEGLADAFSQGPERPCPVSGSVLHGIEPRLKDFHQLLLHPPKVQGRGRGAAVPA